MKLLTFAFFLTSYHELSHHEQCPSFLGFVFNILFTFCSALVHKYLEVIGFTHEKKFFFVRFDSEPGKVVWSRRSQSNQLLLRCLRPRSSRFVFFVLFFLSYSIHHFLYSSEKCGGNLAPQHHVTKPIKHLPPQSSDHGNRQI